MTLDHNEPCVLKHIDLVQSAIGRMASNSNSCKTWCITIVSGIVVVSIDKKLPLAVLMSLFPTFAFAFLDSYYLSLERSFRDHYKGFIRDLHSGTLNVSDLYNLASSASPNHRNQILKYTGKAAMSFSVFPLYSFVIIMIIVIYILLSRSLLTFTCYHG